jgi:hypothetical protein
MSDWFTEAMADMGLSDFFGSGPIPPESVARKVLGIGVYLPLDRAAIKAAFRFRVKLLRPDLPESAADRLRRDDLKGDTATQLAELLWARDDLLGRVKESVTGSGVDHDPNFSRNGEERCKGCQRTWKELKAAGCWGFMQSPSPWIGYCRGCANEQRRARKRDQRQRRRSNRVCACGCGQRFTPARSDGHYASSACRQRAYRQRGGQS